MGFDSWLKERLGMMAPPPSSAPIMPGPTPNAADALLLTALVKRAQMEAAASAPPPPSLSMLGAPRESTRYGNDEGSLMNLIYRAAQSAPPPPPVVVTPPAPASTESQLHGYANQDIRVHGVPGGPAQTGYLNDPLYQKMVAAGATPMQAVQIVQADRESKAQEIRRTTNMANLANDPTVSDPIGGKILDVAAGAPGAVFDAVTNPWDTTKKGVGEFLHVAGYPQRKMELLMAEAAYQGTTNGTAGNFMLDVASKLGPMGPATEELGISMYRWARENPDVVKEAYETGTEFKDDQGVTHTITGREAVVAKFYESMGHGVGGFLRTLGFQTLTDPTLLIPVVGEAGRVLKGASVAEDATRTERIIAGAKQATGKVLTGTEAASNLPERAVVETVGGIYKSAKAIPYVGEGIDAAVKFASEPSARALQATREALTRRALETAAGSEAFDPLVRGITPNDPFAGTSLAPEPKPAAPGGAAAAAVPNIGDVVETVGDVRILSTDGGFTVVDATGRDLTGITYPDVEQARIAATKVATTPAAADVAAAADSAAPETIAPAEPGRTPDVVRGPESMDVLDNVGDLYLVRDAADGRNAVARKTADGNFTIVEWVDDSRPKAQSRFEEIAGTRAAPDSVAPEQSVPTPEQTVPAPEPTPVPESAALPESTPAGFAIVPREWPRGSFNVGGYDVHDYKGDGVFTLISKDTDGFGYVEMQGSRDEVLAEIDRRLVAQGETPNTRPAASVETGSVAAEPTPAPAASLPTWESDELYRQARDLARADGSTSMRKVRQATGATTEEADKASARVALSPEDPAVREAAGKAVRPVDVVAYDIAKENPDAAAAYLAQYETMADDHIARRSAIDLESRRLEGTPRLTNRAEKVFAEIQFAKDQADLFREMFPERAVPEYGYRYGDMAVEIGKDAEGNPITRQVLADFAPDTYYAAPETKGEFAAWFDGLVEQQKIAGDVSRGASTDPFNALIERALGPDDLQASTVRKMLHGYPPSGPNRRFAEELAGELKGLRAHLYDDVPLDAAVDALNAAGGIPAPSVLDTFSGSVRQVEKKLADGAEIAKVGDPYQLTRTDANGVTKKIGRWHADVEFTDGTTRPLIAETKKGVVAKRDDLLAQHAIAEPAPAAAAPEPQLQDASTAATPDAAAPADTGLADDAGRWRAVQAGFEADANQRKGFLDRSARSRTGDPNAKGYAGPDTAVVGKAIREASSLDEAIANLDAYGTGKYGDRADALVPGGRVNRQGNLIANQGEVYVTDEDGAGKGTIGRGWKRVDQLKEGVRQRWAETEGLTADAVPPAPASARAVAEMAPTGGEPLNLTTQSPTAAAAPPAPAAAPATPEPQRWNGQPVAGASKASQRNPMIGLWDEAKAKPTLAEGKQVFEEFGTTQYGPRDGVATDVKLLNGKEFTKYTKGTVGDAWRDVDNNIKKFETEWMKHRGGEANPWPSGRAPIEGTTPAPVDPFPAGGTTPFETAGGNRAAADSLDGTTPWESFDPLNRARETGDITTEQFDLLNQEVEFLPEGSKRGAEPVPTRVVDIFGSYLADGMAADEAIKATLTHLPKAPIKQRGLIGRSLAGMYNGMTTFAREHLMFNALTGGRGIMTDAIGDAWTQIQSGHLESAIKGFDALNPRQWVRYAKGDREGLSGTWKVFSDIRAGTIDAVAATDFGRRIERLGLAAPRTAGFDVIHEVGREEVARGGKMSAQRWLEKISRGAGAGDVAAERIGKAGGVLMSERIKDFRTAWDIFRRSNLAEEVVNTELPKVRNEFFDIVRARTGTGAGDAEQLIAGLGDEFSPRDVRRLAAQAGYDKGTAEFLGREWQRVGVSTLDKTALSEVSRVAFDFAPTKLDEQLKKIFLFHTWQIRAAPLYLRNTLRNPALASAYGHMVDGMQRECQAREGQQCGYLELFSGPAGYVFYGMPMAMLSTALINLEPDQWDNPDATLLDRALGKMPAMVNPAFQGIISAIGLSHVNAPDPFATYTFRKTMGGVIDYALAQGWIGPGGSASGLGEPMYQRLLALPAKLTQAAYDYVGIHGISTPKWVDPQAQDNILIQSRIRDLVYAEYEVPLATDINMLASQYPEADAALNDALDSWQRSKPNPYADQAYRDFTEGKLIKQGLGMGLQGGAQMRSGSQDELTRIINRPTSTTAEQEAASGARMIPRLATPAATNLKFDQAAVNAAPGVMGSQVLNIWNEIAFGDDPEQYTARLGLTNEQVLAMSDEERRGVADLWINTSAPGTRQTLEAARDARDASLAEAPDEQAYRAWRDGARNMPGSVTAFIADMSANNPNYARFIDGYDAYAKRLRDAGETDVMTLDEYATSRDAYLAAIGQKKEWHDASPLPTSTGRSPYYPAAAQTGTGDGATKAAKDPATQLADDLRKYTTEVILYDQAVKNYMGDPNASLNGMNPQLRSAVSWHLGQLGISEPQMPWSVQRYQIWADVQQSNGKPSDVRTYVAWYETLKASLEGTGLDADTIINAAINGNDPFAGTSLGDAPYLTAPYS